MHVPSADELAAITAAYIVATEPSEPPVRTISRWALAGRLDVDPHAVRGRAGMGRWAAAARRVALFRDALG